MITITIYEGPLQDHGTVVVFEGVTDDGTVRSFAVDHRIARDMVDILAGEGSLACGVEAWQLVG